MTDVVYKHIPHGKIPFQTIANKNIREILMQLNENVVVLDRNIEAVCRAINELKRK